MSPFDDPTEFAEAAAVLGAAPGDDRSDAAFAKSAAMRVGIIAAVGIEDLGLAKRSAASAANRWDSVDQQQQLRDIVAVRAGQDHADRNAVRVYEDVAFGPWSCAIGGVWPCFWPAPTARTDDESTAAYEKSSWPDSRSLSSSSPCSLSHTPACCQSCNRRQQVAPEPKPNRVGRWFHRIPVLEHEQDAIECRTVRDRQAPRVSLASRLGRRK